MGGALTGIGLGLAFWLQPSFGWAVFSYVALQAAYSRWLKPIVIVDVMAIAQG